MMLGHGNGSSPCFGCLPPLSQHGPWRGASDGNCTGERRKRAVLGGPRGPAQPVVGWKARELPGGRKGRVVRPKNDQRAAAPFLLHHCRFFQSSHVRAESQQDGAMKKVGSCGDEECVRIFAFGRWGNDPARPCRWSATAACFWKASDGEKSQHCHPRRRDESSPDGGIGNTLYGPAFMPCLR